MSQVLKQQLAQKDEEIRNASIDSDKEARIFKKRAELAEGDAKSSRDKANLLEDVSTVNVHCVTIFGEL